MSADERGRGAAATGHDATAHDATAPDVTDHDVTSTRRGRVSTRTVVLVGVLVSLVLAGFVSSYASSSPDGLEFVAGEKGFLDSGRDPASAGSPFADYATRGVEDGRFSGGLAGVVGVLVVAALAFALFRVLARRRSQR